MHIGAAVRQGIFLSSQRNHKSRLTGAAAGISACFDKDRISCSSRRHFLPPRCCFPAVSRTITITMADLPYKEFVLENGARARLYNGGENASGAFVCVGGVGGGWDSPAQQMYPRMCEKLAQEALRVQYRDPYDVTEGASDVMSGLEYLGAKGVERAVKPKRSCDKVLAGHSLGGAVVLAAGAAAASVHRTATGVDVGMPEVPKVAGIVTLATQTAHAEAPLRQLPSDTRMLFIHAVNDNVLTHQCSRRLFGAVPVPSDLKELLILNEGGHGFESPAAARTVWESTERFLATCLGFSGGSGGDSGEGTGPATPGGA